jgi:hypothetical protein
MPRNEHTDRDWLSCENPSRTEEPGCWEGAAGSSSESESMTHMGRHCECTQLHADGCSETGVSLSSAAARRRAKLCRWRCARHCGGLDRRPSGREMTSGWNYPIR